MSELVKKRSECRVCKGKDLHKVFSLGSTPPANAFLPKEALAKPEQSFPLELHFCKSCGFIQLLDIVSPELLFKDYVYVSSTSPSFVAHFDELAKEVVEGFKLHKDSLVVDIGSNDGILLKPFKARGMRVMGVDPAEKIAKQATEQGVETIPTFFTLDVAKRIVREKGKASLVTATSVFPHIDDLDSLVTAIKELLNDRGIFMIEAYYIADLIEKNLFDTVYHEHLSYFSVKTIRQLLERLGMELFDVQKTDTHGGSLRIFAQKKEGHWAVQERVEEMIARESAKKLDSIDTYLTFAKKVEENKKQLLAILADLKKKGKKIVGYGAAAKATTLTNYFGITNKILDYIVDDSPWKQGLYLPGTKIPVVSDKALAEQKPDYIVILAWNFAKQIMSKHYKAGKFIVPVPKPIIIDDIVDQDLYSITEGIGEQAKLLDGKTLLITGASGFVGSYVVATIDFLNRNMLAKPCTVLAVDNHIVSKGNNLLKDINDQHIRFINHDVCKPFPFQEQVDYIMAAAGIASPTYYRRFMIETLEGTVFGMKNTLEFARAKNVKGLLYFSSSEIYGDPDPNFIPTPEHYKGNVSSTGPRSCYDESKRLGETYAMTYHSVHAVPVKIVRPFNVYGPGMGTTDYRVIPNFLGQGIAGKNLNVHGMGNQTRTFCYVTDAVIGFFKVLLSDKNGEIFNVGNDNDEINMSKLADIIAENVFENKVKVQTIPYPPNYPQDEPQRRCPDLTKIRTLLGYKPSVDVKTGILRTYAWLKEKR